MRRGFEEFYFDINLDLDLDIPFAWIILANVILIQAIIMIWLWRRLSK